MTGANRSRKIQPRTGEKMRAWTPVAAALLLWLQSTSAFAQAKPASGDVRFIGIPEYTSTETGIPFFFKKNADRVDYSYRKIRDAIARCDRREYDKLVTYGFWLGEKPFDGSGPNLNAQIDRDVANSAQAGKQVPPFPEPCNPPGHQGGDRFHPYSLALLGGGFIPLSSTASVTGVDTFTPGNFLIDNRSSNNAGAATGMIGARAQAVWLIRQAMEKEERKWGLGVFVETGVQTGFGSNSLNQSFQNVNTTPQGFGQQTVRENVQVPLLIGLSIALTDGTSVIPPSALNIYGGVTLDSWTHTISGRDGGAPAGPGFNAISNRFTVDPTVGMGWRSSIERSVRGGNFWIGWNVEAQFRPGSVVQAQSANFPSETYYGTVDPRTNVLVMGQIGFSFGGR
jgi:hypothetical protein